MQLLSYRTGRPMSEAASCKTIRYRSSHLEIIPHQQSSTVADYEKNSAYGSNCRVKNRGLSLWVKLQGEKVAPKFDHPQVRDYLYRQV